MAKLIAVSGIDGCGKSTLLHLINDYLITQGIVCRMNSAISGSSTSIGRQIGDILRDPQTECPIPPDAEHALMIAARVLAEVNVIKPALDSGTWVLSDRYALCAMAYQRRADGHMMLPGVYEMRMNLFGLTRKPDFEVIIDIDPARPHKPHDRKNRLEDRSLEEWKKMREVYQMLALSGDNRLLVDGHQEPEKIFDQVKPYIDKLIEDDVESQFESITDKIKRGMP